MDKTKSGSNLILHPKLWYWIHISSYIKSGISINDKTITANMIKMEGNDGISTFSLPTPEDARLKKEENKRSHNAIGGILRTKIDTFTNKGGENKYYVTLPDENDHCLIRIKGIDEIDKTSPDFAELRVQLAVNSCLAIHITREGLDDYKNFKPSMTETIDEYISDYL